MEQDLIKHLNAGDRHAFDRLYGLYAGRIMSFCMKYLNSAEDAEDIVQDVFIALWNNRNKLKNATSVKPFLYTAARNRIINIYRAKVNSPLYEDYVAIRDEHAQEASGSSAIEYKEFEHIVMDCINSLPKTQMAVVTLSRLYNMPVDEIARRLQLRPQTVKNALSSGLKTLRQRLLPLLKYDSVIIFAFLKVFIDNIRV